METPIDLRSDTVTQPCSAMRRAMAEAAVGDDVYGEDPTVNKLQERVADVLGVEAALFVPTGSMADQIAVKALTQPGDEILAAPGAHIAYHEAGATGLIAGAQISILDCDGRFTGEQVEAAFHSDDHHFPPTTVVEVENTHNMGGGRIWPREMLRDVTQTARRLGIATMLDGARLWNAARALEQPERELCADFDLVTVCLSKGLGAPVGSLVAGSRARIHQCHRIRKMLGGGMRQAGIIAAAGLYALEHNRERLVTDHENARFLAESVHQIPGLEVKVDSVETNIVMVDVPSGRAHAWQQSAAERGLLFGAINPRRFRLVTHLDVTRADCSRAVDFLADLAT